jgi:hypothetical protein
VRYNDDTVEEIFEFEMQSLMLNGPNGKLFTHMDDEFVVAQITAHRSPMQSGKRTIFNAESYQFNVLYVGRRNGSWQAYNTSFFEVDIMKDYLRNVLEEKEPGIFQKFERHYKKHLQHSIQQYQYVPSHHGKNACILVTRGNGFVDSLDISTAEEEFGADVVQKIMQQYDSLSTKAQRKLWFHAGSGTPTNYSGCLEKKNTEDSEFPSEAVEKDYIWEICEQWFKLNILKTRGCYCFIAAVLNSIGISLAEAIAMFDHFALLHNSLDEFDYRQASHRFQQYAKELTSF